MRLTIADRLEAEYWPVPDAAIATVVCHPHPLYGGSMHSHVVFRIADACRKQGISAVRFNLRGVGRSTGTYDDGRGEQDDVRAALDFLAEREPGARLWLAGFSFGAAVGGRVGAADPRVQALLLVGLPLRDWDVSYLAGVTKPKAFVSGACDEYGTGLEDFVARLPEPRRLWSVPGATHLFDRAGSGVDASPFGARKDLEAALAEAVSYLREARERPGV